MATPATGTHRPHGELPTQCGQDELVWIASIFIAPSMSVQRLTTSFIIILIRNGELALFPRSPDGSSELQSRHIAGHGVVQRADGTFDSLAVFSNLQGGSRGSVDQFALCVAPSEPLPAAHLAAVGSWEGRARTWDQL